MKELWDILAMEYYSAMKGNDLLIHSEMWMDVKIICEMKKSRQKRVLIYVHNIFLKTTLSLDIPAVFFNFSNYRDICS